MQIPSLLFNPVHCLFAKNQTFKFITQNVCMKKIKCSCTMYTVQYSVLVQYTVHCSVYIIRVILCVPRDGYMDHWLKVVP